MKKILLVLVLAVVLMTSIAPAVLAMDKFFQPAICDIADGYPSAWGTLCLIAWLMDLWLDPIDMTPR